jgi:hypothetical protein
MLLSNEMPLRDKKPLALPVRTKKTAGIVMERKRRTNISMANRLQPRTKMHQTKSTSTSVPRLGIVVVAKTIPAVHTLQTGSAMNTPWKK